MYKNSYIYIIRTAFPSKEREKSSIAIWKFEIVGNIMVKMVQYSRDHKEWKKFKYTPVVLCAYFISCLIKLFCFFFWVASFSFLMYLAFFSFLK